MAASLTAGSSVHPRELGEPRAVGGYVEDVIYEPDPRDRRKRKKPQPKRPAVRTGPSPDDPHDVVYFKRHRADDPSEPEPGREALNSHPAKVRATMRAVLIAVASAPPKRFADGGYWEAMVT